MVLLHSWKNHHDHIYTIDYDPSSSTCTGSVNTNLPFVEDDDLQYFGCCNGLVCVSPYDRDIILIWNPSTNVFKKLPKLPILDTPVTGPDNQDYDLIDIQYGFCYNYESGEFKVVCLARYNGDSGDEVKGSDVYLYTSGSNTWITLDSIFYHVISERNQVPINGVIHWKEYRMYDEVYRRVILAFDFEKEVF
ncbi:F-box protein At5g49610-like [Papaver somniferum]|uniref:F-box protein At5g49610-like n=1 Tax=Papaver somniferum TaxID=3469 RepID=UPI000E6FB355|nr:F-box protein At5g49610-like [Papaver somniferum]